MSSLLTGVERCGSSHLVAMVGWILMSVVVLQMEAATAPLVNESLALVSFRSATGGTARWKTVCRSGWATFTVATMPCVLNQTDGNNSYVSQLYGVGCTTNLSAVQTVTSIALGNCSLMSMDFADAAAAALTNLTALEHLDISYNNLGGTLFDPRIAWTALEALRVLSVSSNGFLGTLPSETLSPNSWRWPPRLINFTAGFNALSGALPELPRHASIMSAFDVQSNRLNGTFPPTWESQFLSLEVLAFTNNSIAGAVPQGVNWPRMRVLGMGSNQLQGTLPARTWATHMPQLTNIDVSINGLLGNETHLFGSLRNLSALLLRANLFTGTLPNEFCNCTKLVVLTMDLNLFSGTLPTCYAGLNRTLTSLWMGGKEEEAFKTMNPAVLAADRAASLSGTIPESYGQLSLLEDIVIGNAPAVMGTLPTTLCMCSGIVRIYVYNTSVNGTIPSCYGTTFLALTNFRFQRNQLSGTLPNATEMPAIRTSMRNLWLDNNNFSGTIPSDWGPMASMMTIALDNNSLTGTVPDKEWGAANTTFRVLQGISLSNNSLHGTVPFFSKYVLQQQGSFALQHMTGFAGSRNLFTGTIPDWNTTLWTPLLLFFDVSHNRLNGTLPQLLLCCSPNLVVLNLSHNALTGFLPDMHAANTAMLVLLMDRVFDPAVPPPPPYLSAATPNRTIPVSWSLRYRSIVQLSLTQNRLQGTLDPALLTNLANSLVVLNISYNELEGPLPTLSPTRLVLLDVSNNRFGGALPLLLPPIASGISLANNRFTGTIPLSWASATNYMQRLIGVDVSGNHLRGPLPSIWSSTWERTVAVRNCICGFNVPQTWISQSPATAVAFSPPLVCVPARCVVTGSHSLLITGTTTPSMPTNATPSRVVSETRVSPSPTARGTVTRASISLTPTLGRASSASLTFRFGTQTSPRHTKTTSIVPTLSGTHHARASPSPSLWNEPSSSHSTESGTTLSLSPSSSPTHQNSWTSSATLDESSASRSASATMRGATSSATAAMNNSASSSASASPTSSSRNDQPSTSLPLSESPSLGGATSSVQVSASASGTRLMSASHSETAMSFLSHSLSLSNSTSTTVTVAPITHLGVQSAATLLVQLGDAAATAVVAPLAAATLAGSATIVQQSILALKLRQCAFEGPLDSLRVSDSPTQWKLAPPAEEAAARGAAVGNVLLIVAVGGVCLIAGAVVYAVRARKAKRSQQQQLKTVRRQSWFHVVEGVVTTAGLPGRLNVGLSFLYQPLVAASVLLLSTGVAGDVLIGLVVLGTLSAVTLFLLRRVYQTASRCMCLPRDTTHDNVVVRCFGPKFKWVTLHDAVRGGASPFAVSSSVHPDRSVATATSAASVSDDDDDMLRLHRYDFLFSKSAAHAYWLFAAQHATSFCLGILAGVRPQDRSACDRGVIFLLLIVSASLLLVVWVRPYHTMRDNVCAAGLQALGLVNAALLIADFGEAADAIVLLQLAFLLVYSSGKMAAQLSIRLRQRKLSRVAPTSGKNRHPPRLSTTGVVGLHEGAHNDDAVTAAALLKPMDATEASAVRLPLGHHHTIAVANEDAISCAITDAEERGMEEGRQRMWRQRRMHEIVHCADVGFPIASDAARSRPPPSELVGLGADDDQRRRLVCLIERICRGTGSTGRGGGCHP